MPNLTIKEQPTAGVVFAKSPILYSILSTDYTSDDFEYIIDVYIWQGETTTIPTSYSYRLRKPRNSVTGSAVVDISSLCTDYFLNMPITFSTLDDTQEMQANVLVKFGYSYTDGSGDYQQEIDITTSNQLSIYNGYTIYEEGINYAAIPFHGESVSSQFLTNKPLISDIPNDTNLKMAMVFKDDTAISIRYVINGTETIYVDLKFFDIGLIVFGAGVPNLPTHTTADADITSYTICTTDSNDDPVSNIYTFNIFTPCKYGYKNLQFLNRFGQWDNIILRGMTNEMFKTDKAEYMFSPLGIDVSSEFEFNQYKGQFHNVVTNGRSSLTLNTGWIDEDWNDVIKELLMSEKVFDADTLQPVTINTSSLAIRTSLNEGLTNYTIEVQEAYSFINTVN